MSKAINGPQFTKDVIEAYQHFLIYTRGNDCVAELANSGAFGECNIQHLLDKYSWYCSLEKNGTDAMSKFIQYYLVRSNAKRYGIFLDYLKKHHWNKW